MNNNEYQINSNKILVKVFSSKIVLFLAIAYCISMAISSIISFSFSFNNLDDILSAGSLSSLARALEDIRLPMFLCPAFAPIALIIVLFIMRKNAKYNTTNSFNGCLVVIKIFAIIGIVNAVGLIIASFFTNIYMIIGSILILILHILINSSVTSQKNAFNVGVCSTKYLKTIAIFLFIISGLSILTNVINFVTPLILIYVIIAALVDIFFGVAIILYASAVRCITLPYAYNDNNEYKNENPF